MVMSRTRTYDVALELLDAGAKTASAAGDSIIDTGAEIEGWNAPMGPSDLIGQTYEAKLIVDVSAVDVASADESYDFIIQGSPDSDFGTAGNIVDLGSVQVGHLRSDSTKVVGVGRYTLAFNNIHLDKAYRYLRLYVVVAGTSPSVNATARLGINRL